MVFFTNFHEMSWIFNMIVNKWFLCVFQAAKETGALQDAKNKLEKELGELTSCLELEKQMRVLKVTHNFSRWIIYFLKP